MEKVLEKQIKQYILDNQFLIEMATGNLGQSVLSFEKVVLHNNLRTDCLVYSEQGLIGIEIKTEYDNLNRLRRQLLNYAVVCHKVIVFVHESHLADVLELLEELHLDEVGVISYEVIKGSIQGGVDRPCLENPRQDLTLLLPTAWKSELTRMLVSNYEAPRAILSNYKQSRYNNPQKTLKRFRELYSSYKRIPRQKILVNMIIERFGRKYGEQLFCNLFISRDCDIQKPLRLYDWKDRV